MLKQAGWGTVMICHRSGETGMDTFIAADLALGVHGKLSFLSVRNVQSIEVCVGVILFVFTNFNCKIIAGTN